MSKSLKIAALTAGASVPAGTRIMLTADQLRRRAHLVRQEGRAFVSDQALTFKRGESVEIDGPLFRSSQWAMDSDIQDVEFVEVEPEEPTEAPEFSPLSEHLLAEAELTEDGELEEPGEDFAEPEETEEEPEDQPVDRPLSERHRDELMHMAAELGLKPHHNTGHARLVEMITEAQAR